MLNRTALWTGFVLVHVAVALLGHVVPGNPMGDVYLVYEPWSQGWLHGGVADPAWSDEGPRYVGLVGVTEPWVYPQLALVPMLAAWLFAPVAGYVVGWAIMVTLLDAAAFAVLVGRGRSRGRSSAAWFWLAFILALGPVGLYRVDAVTVPLAIIGCLWLAGRPWAAATLLAVATWIKVWPAALLAAALIALRRRVPVVGASVAVSAAVAAVVISAGGAAHLFGFVGDQTGRGIQLEAPVGVLYLWQAVAGVDGSFLYYDPDILTFQLAGPHVDVVIAAMTPLMAVAAVVVAAVGVVKTVRGARFAALFPALALGLILVLIVFNKVGSPQFMTWLVAPVAVGLVFARARWRGPALMVLVIAALTHAVYPLLYDALLAAQALPAAVLTVRNALVVALLVWVVVRLCRVPVAVRPGTAERAA